MGYGKLIAFEGPDTAGKSSIIEKLKIVLPAVFEKEKFIYTREPGNLISEQNESEEIRNILLNNNKTIKEQSELFAKARYLHTIDIIKKLKEGYNVITDRYILSSLYYQGLILGYEAVFEDNKETIDMLNEEQIKLNTIVFKISESTYNERMSTREQEKDALENVDNKMVLDRIDAYNSASYGDELKHINQNKVYTINANGTDYNRILLDTLDVLNIILKEEK